MHIFPSSSWRRSRCGRPTSCRAALAREGQLSADLEVANSRLALPWKLRCCTPLPAIPLSWADGESELTRAARHRLRCCPESLAGGANRLY